MEHVVAPVTEENVPPAHAAQLVAPEFDWALPVEHEVHMTLPVVSEKLPG